MKMKKFLIMLLVAGGFAGVALGTVSFLAQDNYAREVAFPPPEYERAGSVRATIIVEGQKYEVWVPEGATALEFMKLLQDSRGFSFRGRQFPGLGFLVEEINGLTQNPKEGMYWIYYINGETASVGVSQYILQPNDIIEWKYEPAN